MTSEVANRLRRDWTYAWPIINDQVGQLTDSENEHEIQVELYERDVFTVPRRLICVGACDSSGTTQILASTRPR